MEGPRSAKVEEFNKVIDLINHVFRITRGHKPTMQEEFPLLLNKNNIENLIGIHDSGKVVSEVNFLEEKILVEGSEIKAASIGGVCTHEDYRGKNYASKILDKVEEKLYEKGVDLVLISGDRTLYTRRQCMKVKNFNEYIIKPYSEYKNLNLVPYEDRYLDSMIKIYNSNSTRYYRTYDEFKTLLHSATIKWGSFTYKKYVILKDEILEGYIILRIIDGKEKYGQVIEALGNVEYINEELRNIAFELDLKYIKHYVHIKDKFNRLKNYENISKDYLHGTVKIINFKKFMEDLKPYFSQYIEKKVLEQLNFIEDQKGYGIKLEDEILYFDSIGEITKLVFEGIDSSEFEKRKEADLGNKPKLKIFIKKVFPIPFVWTANLNYQ